MQNSKIRVVVDESRPVTRLGICNIINDTEDMEAVGSSDSDKALLRLISKEKPSVIVMTISSAVAGRQAMVTHLKQEYPQTGILLISDSMAQGWGSIHVAAGASGYISSNASVDQIRAAIRTVFTAQAVIDLHFLQECAQLSLMAKTDSRVSNNRLNVRELQVLQMAAKGSSNKAISQQLHISEHTVHSCFRSIFRKEDASSRTEAIYRALVDGVIKLEGV